jgi:hypothetical protein
MFRAFSERGTNMRQATMQGTVLCLALIVGSWAIGCSESPTTPARIPQSLPALQRPPIATPSNPSNALVTVDDPLAIVHNEGSRFGYAARFLLRETGGMSGATIDRVVVYGPSGSDETGVGCWRDTLRVPAKGELDTFYTDAGANWLGYCGPGSGGYDATPSLYVVVTFRDDSGVVGSIGGQISTLR